MIFLLALGANLPSEWGKPAETLSYAVGLISERICDSIKQSPLYATPAFPEESEPEFVNAAVVLECDLLPHEVLRICHEIEAEARRTRDLRWGPRTLDIDLIACDAQVIPNLSVQTHWRTLPMVDQARVSPDTLILPHPRVQDRAFVLVPMMDVAPNWVHPVLGQTTADMLARLPEADKRAVRRLEMP